MKRGDTKWFEYHCYEGEDSGDAELWHRTHQQATILGEVSADPEIGKMYRVRFADGFAGDVFADELVDTPSEFHRPDYTPKKPPKKRATHSPKTKKQTKAPAGVKKVRR